MKNGLIIEDGVPIYYENDMPKHAGVVKIDGVIYYAGHGGRLATGYRVVHKSMANGLLKHGTYKFDDDGKLVEDFYIAPKKNKKTKKKGGKIKLKTGTKILIMAVTIVLIGALFCIGLLINLKTSDKNISDPSAGTTQSQLELPEFDSEVYLCSEPMKRYYNGEITIENAVALKGGAYKAFEFQYKLPDMVTATLDIDGVTYELDPNETSLMIDNLMTGKKYQYTVTVIEHSVENTKTTIYDGHFTTAATNRFIYLPGVLNTRDIGGYDTNSGKKVRQGLLIRGTEVDGLVESKYFLTDKSAAEIFGFKCDLDLRESALFSGNYKSRLGDDVKHRFYSSPMYGGIFAEGSYSALKEIFADLANPENYPMYLHCTYGADRTGTIIFLLQGLLGVSEEDMKLEYALTGFMTPGYEKATNLNGIYGGLEGSEGDTINEKVENFLVNDVGVTREEIESIRNIFLED